MSLENQVSRVSKGTKDTLKTLINKLGGNVTDELIDQYPAIASALDAVDPAGSAQQALNDAKSYTDQKISEIPTPDVSGQINTHNTDTSAHSDIRESITTHTGDASIHVTAEEKTEWNAKADAPFKPAGKSYLTFSSPNSFTLAVGDATKHWNGTLEYFASDKTWTVWDGTTTLSAVDNDGEYVLYLRGTGNTVITGNNQNYKWVLTGSGIKCIGNIENLLDYATVESGAHPTMASYCYNRMFNGCTALTQAPALPAITLADYCYASMFSGCTSLIQAPALPATTLAPYCYYSMFYGCTSLTHVPALSATTLLDYCYRSMFNGCTSLTQAPSLPATTLANYCYYGMFYGCTGIKLSTTQTDEYTQEYRIPFSGTGTTATKALNDMFTSTGGTFKGTPSINTTYYLSSDNMVVHETEVATLREYVGSIAAPASHARDTDIHVTAEEKAKWNGKSEKSVAFTVTLTATGWSVNAQTVSNSKFVTSGYAYTVCPAGDSFAGYTEAVIYADDVTTAGKMTFHCYEAPMENLTVNILRTEVTA